MRKKVYGIRRIEVVKVTFDGQQHTFQRGLDGSRSYEAERAILHVLADGKPRNIIVTRERGEQEMGVPRVQR